MATNNAVNNGLTGVTGTGSFVGSTSPTLTTPAIGTPSSGTLTNCSGLPLSAGTVCTTTNDSASAGQIGEFVTSNVVSGSAVAMNVAGVTNITSISLTAGDWDVWGNIFIKVTTPSVSEAFWVWISTTSATQPNDSLTNSLYSPNASLTYVGLSAPQIRLSLSATTTVYLSGSISSTAASATGCGTLSARRVR